MGKKWNGAKGNLSAWKWGDSCNLVTTGINEKAVFKQRLEQWRG